MSKNTVAESLKAIKSALSSLPPISELNDHERRDILAACEQVRNSVESPYEFLLRVGFSPGQCGVVEACVDMGVFDMLVAAGGAKISAKEIADKTGAQQELIVRLMRVLTGMELAIEASHEAYSAGRFNETFVKKAPMAAALAHLNVNNLAALKLPSFFRTKGLINPTDAFDGPFQHALDTSDNYFGWLAKHPVEQENFNITMQVQRQDRGEDWFNFFPVEQKLKAADSSAPLFVDIGGGYGHDVAAFKARYPNLSGKFVLADLPIVMQSVRQKGEDRGFDVVDYNFLEGPPIKDAKAYYMRSILHDWPDKQALTILKNIRAAANSGSMLLINEIVLPESGAGLEGALYDLNMMVALGSLERTRTQWTKLLKDGGWQIVKAWEPTPNPLGVTLLEATPV